MRFHLNYGTPSNILILTILTPTFLHGTLFPNITTPLETFFICCKPVSVGTHESTSQLKNPLLTRFGIHVRYHKRLYFSLRIFHNINLCWVNRLLSSINSTSNLIHIFQRIAISPNMSLLLIVLTHISCMFEFWYAPHNPTKILVLISSTNTMAFRLILRSFQQDALSWPLPKWKYPHYIEHYLQKSHMMARESTTTSTPSPSHHT